MIRGKILIVDDIFSNRLLLSSALESIGIESKSVGNGQAAIDSLQEESFGLVLLDIEMPVMNGLETVRYIRNEMPAHFNNLPVIALTAHNPLEYGNEMDAAGFTEILTKPYSIERLQDLISKYLIDG
ncbi:MAG: response regulator [Chloroflexia bacterium]|nr:response regulator [Chloroflexia bacterium]